MSPVAILLLNLLLLPLGEAVSLTEEKKEKKRKKFKKSTQASKLISKGLVMTILFAGFGPAARWPKSLDFSLQLQLFGGSSLAGVPCSGFRGARVSFGKHR